MLYFRLYECRTYEGLTQQALCEKLCIPRGSYAAYETGGRPVPAEALSILADFYQTSVDYLISRTDTRSPYPPRLFW